MFTLAACLVIEITIDFLDSILSDRLEKAFGLQENTVGFVFAVPFATYTLGCYPVALLAEKLDRRVTIALSCTISTLALFFTGPS